jgi:hypothetical protein
LLKDRKAAHLGADHLALVLGVSGMVVYHALVQEPLMLNFLELSLLLAGFLVEGIVIGFIMPQS